MRSYRIIVGKELKIDTKVCINKFNIWVKFQLFNLMFKLMADTEFEESVPSLFK